MNCNEFQSQLDQALDERQPSDQELLSGHAASCPACQRLWDDWLLLEQAVNAWKDRPTTVEVDLTDRVIDAARGEGLVSANGMPVDSAPVIDPPDIGTRRRGLLPLIVTAALVLIAALVVFRDGQNHVANNDGNEPDEKPPEELVVVPDESIVPDLPDIPLPEQQPDFDHMIADARLAWQSLTQRASLQANSFSVFIPSRDDIGLEESDEVEPEESPEEPAVPVPLPDGVNRAFDFLFEQSGAET